MRRIYKSQTSEEEVNVNIIPLIDVLFSILIAFMIPTQSLFGGLDIEIPTADAKIVVLEKEPIKVFIDKNGNIIINEIEIKFKDLAKRVEELSLKDRNIKIYVLADKINSYGRVLDVVGRLNKYGYNDVVLISDLYNRL